MQQNRAGVNLGCKKSLFCQLWEDVSDLYTSAADTYQPACNLVCCSCRCRTCSTTISRLISAAVTVSYLRQNSRLLDDNGGPVVGSQFCSVAKMCGSNRIRQSGLPLTKILSFFDSKRPSKTRLIVILRSVTAGRNQGQQRLLDKIYPDTLSRFPGPISHNA